MPQRRRASLVGGLVLILVGLLILGVQLTPRMNLPFSWAWFILGFGFLLFVIGTATGVTALVIPACIVGGIGGILYYQTVTGDWDSWAYIWALIPGFVGLGLILAGLMGADAQGPIRVGALLLLISVTLFSTFGSFFGALGLMGDYWPLLLILLGVLLLVGTLTGRRRWG